MFRTTNALFWYFWAIIVKSYCYIWNQNPQICDIGKFRKKMAKFGTKNTLFGYFWTRIFKSYCCISNERLQICQICSIPEFHEKQNYLRFGSQMRYLGIFGLEFSKLLSYWKSAPSNLWNSKISRKNKKA